MPLATNSPNEVAPNQRLAIEARARLSELGNVMLLTYGNLLNYQHNNSKGVSPDQFDKALGTDLKDFRYVLRAMKRMLLRLNPAFKAKLTEMVPKKTKKAAP
jgi:hypothetical protein